MSAALETLVLKTADVAGLEIFVKSLGAEDRVEVRPTGSPATGFTGWSLSLVCSQPADVDALVEAAGAAGATVLKPAAKSFWGYGAILQAPGGSVWKLAASSKKNSGPAREAYDDLVLLLGVADVKAARKAYADRGLPVAKSFGGKYAEFATAPVTLALYPAKAAAKEAGLPLAGGSRGIVLRGNLGAFTDSDGYSWDQAEPR